MYTLDTNTCIAILNGKPERVFARFDLVRRNKVQVLVSSIVAHELWYGAHRSTRLKYNADRLHDFFSDVISELSFNAEDAEAAGQIRATLERSGLPIGPYDTLIAGQALNRGLILVTANTREFERVTGLRVENWTAV